MSRKKYKKEHIMKRILYTVMALFLLTSISYASLESKTWPASDKAKKFVKDTVVIGFFASPYGTGWTKDEHLHDYLQHSRDAGITGHDMTLAAGSYTWDQ
jgi:membrane dipeptidase